LIGAAGISHPSQITRSHIYRRVFMNEVRTFEDIFPSVKTGAFLRGEFTERYKQDFEMASAGSWGMNIE
ncbi:MAG: FMN-binding glutamate synthase family protein, partial [Dinghuibacter sp.]|nr:FMN-binding glutamate synthase family protein [Dinghuibacter sp.]